MTLKSGIVSVVNNTTFNGQPSVSKKLIYRINWTAFLKKLSSQARDYLLTYLLTIIDRELKTLFLNF